ncbi:hypothetical protein DF182_10915 [Chitinophaga flava]|uniref:EVE domain-containing protein n=2 Tax=Chitinophaga flava TaxID=2259036 RepID=A0A365Y393_9BACT|nr:hypothetical protein DF182_10915 [Chitinophaga flava]
MAYYINLFSPATYEAFSNSDKSLSGFMENKRSIAKNLGPGDKLICYVTKLSRWIGVMEINSLLFENDKPIYLPVNDPYTLRFKINPAVWLPFEQGIPITDDRSFNHLSFTSTLPAGSNTWTVHLRSNLRRLKDEDGAYLEKILLQQQSAPVTYTLTDADQKKIDTSVTALQTTGAIELTIPEREDPVILSNQPIPKESIRIQAKLAEIGEKMGFSIWLPKADRQRVLEHWHTADNSLLETLPLNYVNAVLKTIENIDVLWISRNMIVRAFEVEHTTSVYSGILRMADLMALQPNMNVKLHIVAPQERRDKVFQEITRPVFSFMEHGPMKNTCTYLSYESVLLIAEDKHLASLKPTVLDEYDESAPES